MRDFAVDFLKNFLRPWKQSGYTRVLGWANLAIFAFVFLSFFISWFIYLALFAIGVGTVCMVTLMRRDWRDMQRLNTRIKHTELAEQVMTGQVKMSDLSFEDQEKVRDEMARFTLWLKDR